MPGFGSPDDPNKMGCEFPAVLAIGHRDFSPNNLGGGVAAAGSLGSGFEETIAYIPFEVHKATTIHRVSWMNGAAASDTVTLGIYDKDGNQLAVTAATARSGANQRQIVAFTISPTLSPGRYYLAFLETGTHTGTYFFVNLVGVIFTGLSDPADYQYGGVLCQSGATSLPAIATFEPLSTFTLTSLRLPFFSLYRRASP